MHACRHTHMHTHTHTPLHTHTYADTPSSFGCLSVLSNELSTSCVQLTFRCMTEFGLGFQYSFYLQFHLSRVQTRMCVVSPALCSKQFPSQREPQLNCPVILNLYGIAQLCSGSTIIQLLIRIFRPHVSIARWSASITWLLMSQEITPA